MEVQLLKSLHGAGVRRVEKIVESLESGVNSRKTVMGNA